MDWFTTGHDIRGWMLPSDHNNLSLPILRPGHFVWAGASIRVQRKTVKQLWLYIVDQEMTEGPPPLPESKYVPRP